MAEAKLDPGLERLQAAPHRFELAAILKALLARGFSPEQIHFEGMTELEHVRGPLVSSLRLKSKPKLAIIKLNAGLLSPNSPLPSYFRDFAARLLDPDPFLKFIGFWDSVLLRNHACCATPRFCDPHQALCQSYLPRLNLEASSCLHWLFRSAFPELSVEIGRRRFQMNRSAARVRVGDPLDGRAVLGGQYRERQEGFRVRLHVEHKRSEGVCEWEREARRRLQWLLSPQLSRLRVPLAVTLCFQAHRYGLELVGAERGQAQLGTRPWQLADPGHRVAPAEIHLWGPWQPLARQRTNLPLRLRV